MSKTENIIVIGTFGLTALFIVLFNLNMPHYWNNVPHIVPEIAIDSLWFICMSLSIATLFLCIRDTGKRNLTNRAGWVAYMLLIGVIGIPHYYIKYGRFPRA